MNNKVLVIGAAFVDVLMDIPSIPQSGGDVTAVFHKNVVGGSAFNVYGALQYEHAKSDLFVPVGKGQYSNVVRKVFKDKHIPILIERDEKDNGWDLCLVEPSGERTFITVPGIDQLWTQNWFDNIELDDYKYFYISGYETENLDSTNVILDQLEHRNNDAYILFDASPRIKYMNQTIINRFLTRNVIVHCNQDEIGYLSTEDTLQEQMADIYRKTDSPVIVTLGSEGARLYDQNRFTVITSEKAKVVNTIGAGDTHCGGILAGLQQGLNLTEAIQLGNELSLKVVQQQAGSL